MSIFEPIPRESHVDDDTHEFEQAAWDDDPASGSGSFDPRSIWIAGIVVTGIVGFGLMVSNAAQPEAQRPALASRIDPGAAAVEQAEVKQNLPPSASPAVEPVDESSDDGDADESPSWEDSGDDESWSDDGQREGKPDKPGKGRGHGRD